MSCVVCNWPLTNFVILVLTKRKTEFYFLFTCSRCIIPVVFLSFFLLRVFHPCLVSALFRPMSIPSWKHNFPQYEQNNCGLLRVCFALNECTVCCYVTDPSKRDGSLLYPHLRHHWYTVQRVFSRMKTSAKFPETAKDSRHTAWYAR